MKNANPESLALTLLKGALVGLVATQVLDIVGTLTYRAESAKTRTDENAARSGRQAYEVAVARIAKGFGRTLTREEEKAWGWRFHKAFGIAGGIQYLMLRKKYPKIAAGMGLAYGAGFFILADEVLIYLFKLTPGPRRFSWKVHARGAAAHTAYGIAAETTLRAIEALPKLLIPEDAYLIPKNMSL